MEWRPLDNPLFSGGADDDFAKFHFKLAARVPPPELFHYTTSESLLAIIESRRLFATERSCLNDPEEYEYGISAFRSRLTSQAVNYSGEFVEDSLRALSTKTHGELRLFVLSLSANPDLLAQWRTYAGEGSGFAIGLDGLSLRDRAGFGEQVLNFIDLAKLPEDIVFCYHLLPVIYEKGEQEEVLDNFMSASYAYWKTIDRKRDLGSPSIFDVVFSHRIKEVLISLKSPGYQEEREWRVVATVHKRSGKIKYRSGRFGITPYVVLNLSCRTELPHFTLPISSIWAGPVCPAKRNRGALEMLCETHGIKAPLRSSEIPYRTS